MNEPTFAALAKFAAKVLDAAMDGSDVDGGDVQDWAVEAGLLVTVEVTGPCGEVCPCEEAGDFPQTCYRQADVVVSE